MKFAFIFLLGLPFFCPAQKNTAPAFQQKALLLKRFLDKNHFQPVKWNDSTSVMLYNKWLDELDGEKLLFTQKDITVFEAYKNVLDDEMNGKGWGFFSVTTDIFRSRIARADSVIQVFLSKPADYIKPDSIAWPYKTYAANEQEFTRRWQRYLKWQILDNISDEIIDNDDSLAVKFPLNFVQMEKAERQRTAKREGQYIKSLLRTKEIFSSEMQSNYLNAIAWCYDPHTNYMNTKVKDEFNAEVSATEYSAGFSFEENEKGEKAIDVLQPGGSAWRSGQLHKGDVLIKVKKSDVEKNAEDMSPAELSQILSGNNKEDMELTVRTAAGQIKKVKLIPEKITDEEGIVKSYVIKSGKNIGYINLPGFYSREEEGAKEVNYNGCANDVSKEIIKLKKDNIAALILDLRNNGGGSMWEAIQLAGIFIDAGPVASVKEKDGKVIFMKDPNRGTIFDGPMIVLINGASASASEFLSAALQDYNRALIVGGSTYGKGTAQVVVPLDTLPADPYKKYDDFVKVTERKFYRVNGSTVQWQGVIPDIALPDIYSNIKYKEKANKSALTPDLSRKGMFQPLEAIPTDELRSKSSGRIQNDPYFKLIAEFSARSLSGSKEESIPLNWPGFVKYHKKIAESLPSLKEGLKVPAADIIVRNNSFDYEKIMISEKQIQEINKSYLKNISEDKEIAEACRIFADWIH